MALNARAKNKNTDYVLFDVFYDDGSQTSNRKVPVNALLGQDEESEARAFLEAQDRKLGQASGNPRGDIVRVTRRTGR